MIRVPPLGEFELQIDEEEKKLQAQLEAFRHKKNAYLQAASQLEADRNAFNLEKKRLIAEDVRVKAMLNELAPQRPSDA